MKTWFSENWTEETKFSLLYDKRLLTKQTAFQQMDIYHSKEWGNFLTLDGLLMVTEKDEFIYHDMIVHPALCVNPHIKKVLVIGGGDGGTVRELTRYPSISQIDMVEIDEAVVQASREYLPTLSSKLDDQRVNLFFEDGVSYVANSAPGSYDLILVDSTDPIGPGEGLFTESFYQNCFNILTEEGILINQHESPYFKTYAKEMSRAHKKLEKVFPISKVYQFHQAIYPSGHWLFGFASKKLDPIQDQQVDMWNLFNLNTKYYNTDLHKGAFMLPSYVRDLLGR